MKNTFDVPSPCFVLNESLLIRNLEKISSIANRADVNIIVAFKGFAMWSSFPIVRKYIKNATASSLNEAMLCEEKMGTKAHTYCVAYDHREFKEIAARSSHLTFNSLSQYETFISSVPEDVSVGLRVNPGWSDVETDLYNPSNPTSRLGIESGQMKTIPEGVEGLHFHVLCESSADSLVKVLNSFEKRFSHLLKDIKWVNIGGGHLMTRDDYDDDLLVTTLIKFKEKHSVDVIMEPGSAFAWQVGVLETTVLDIVENGGVKTAIIDASFTCHMPDCLEMPYRPAIVNASSEKKENGNSYRIGGVSCLAGDYLDEYWFENKLKQGDRVIFEDMIHYTMVKTTMFNGVKHPSIAIRRLNGEVDIVRSFGYEDYRNRLS